jgi:hypothetical protein
VVRGAWRRHVDDQALAAGAVQVEHFVREGHRADGGMAEDLLAVPGPAHLVASPQAAEVGALDHQLTDEGSQVGGVGVAAGDGAELGDAAARLLLPVGEQVPGRGVQERVPDRVALPGGPLGQAGVQPRAARVGGEHVVGAAEYVGRVRAHGLEQQADRAADRSRRRRGRLGRAARGLRRQRPQELALVGVQQQRPGQGLDHPGARPGLPAAFQPRVVVDAHARERGEFLAAQPRGAPRGGRGRQADIRRADAFAAGAQEAAQLGRPRLGHAFHSGRRRGRVGGRVTPPLAAPWKPRPGRIRPAGSRREPARSMS